MRALEALQIVLSIGLTSPVFEMKSAQHAVSLLQALQDTSFATSGNIE